jgi:hypothetical protein
MKGKTVRNEMSVLRVVWLGLMMSCAEPITQDEQAAGLEFHKGFLGGEKPELPPALLAKADMNLLAVLSNNVPVTGLEGLQGSEQRWTLPIPANTAKLVVTTDFGPGDADLYIKYGSPPTTSVYDCRGFSGINTEKCTFDGPQQGTWHIMVRGYRDFSGVTLLASHTQAGSFGAWDAGVELEEPACTIVQFVGMPVPCLSGAQLQYALPDGSGGAVTGHRSLAADTASFVIYNTLPNAVFEVATYEEIGITFASGAPAYCTSNLSITSSPLPAAGWPSGTTTRVESGEPWGKVATSDPNDDEAFPRYLGIQGSTPEVTAASIAGHRHPCKTTVQFKMN